MEVFKKLHINIPFANALEQMPSYVKFVKDILSRKIRLSEFEIVNLTEECSAILQRKLPHKLKDPGSFTIPCKIGNSIFERALCDLGELDLRGPHEREIPTQLGGTICSHTARGIRVLCYRQNRWNSCT